MGIKQMKRLEFIIYSQIIGGKNHMQIDPRSGRHYPNKRFAVWRDTVVRDLRFYLDQIKFTESFDKPVSIQVKYWNGDQRRRDVPAMWDSLFHVCEKAGVITDDFLFQNCNWIAVKLDREEPRIEVEIEEL